MLFGSLIWSLNNLPFLVLATSVTVVVVIFRHASTPGKDKCHKEAPSHYTLRQDSAEFKQPQDIAGWVTAQTPNLPIL